MRSNRRDFLKGIGITTAIGTAGVTAGRAPAHTDRSPQRGRDFFVDPNQGNDEWIGNQPEPVDNGNGPLATIDEALVRAWNKAKGLEGSTEGRDFVNVWLRAGRYERTTPIDIGPHDTSIQINVQAYPNEEPMIDGGRAIDGWGTTTVNGIEAWKTTISEVNDGDWYFEQLFVDGERRERPTIPEFDSKWKLHRLVDVPDAPEKSNWSNSTKLDVNEFVLQPEDVADWHNPTDIELVLPHRFFLDRLPVKSMDSQTDTIITTRGSRAPLWEYEQSQGEESGWSRYYLENVFEALDSPGEWYLDRQTGELFYVPMEGETMGDTEVVAPVTDQLLRVEGNPTTTVEGENPTSTNWTRGGNDPVHDRDGISGGQELSLSEENLPKEGEYTVTYTFETEMAARYRLNVAGGPPNKAYMSTYEYQVNGGAYQQIGNVSVKESDRVAGPVFQYTIDHVDLEKGENTITFRVIDPRPRDGKYVQIIDAVSVTATERPVENLSLIGLNFQYGGWEQPATQGYRATVDRTEQRGEIKDFGSSFQGRSVAGTVHLSHVRNTSVRDCWFEHLGLSAVTLTRGGRNVGITRNEIKDVGAVGVLVDGGKSFDPDYTQTRDVTVADNTITRAGRIAKQAVGISIETAADTSIVHNHVHNLFYTGIHIGRSYQLGEYLTRGTRIEANHVHNIGQGLLNDLDGIHLVISDVAPDTVVRRNLVHDVKQFTVRAFGIRCDADTSNITIEGNVVYNVNQDEGAWGINTKGKENLVRNNIFVAAPARDINSLGLSSGSGEVSARFERNVIVPLKEDHPTENLITNGPDVCNSPPFVSDHNLFWNPSDGEVFFTHLCINGTRKEPADTIEGETPTSTNFTRGGGDPVHARDGVSGGKELFLSEPTVPEGGYTATYTVTVPETGSYGIEVAGGPPSRAYMSPLSYAVNGGDFQTADVSVDDQVSGPVWNYMFATVDLVAGENTITFRVTETREIDDRYVAIVDKVSVVEAGSVLLRKEFNLTEWQSVYGLDEHSLLADPQFMHLEDRDLSLSSSSPAFDLGFEQIDLSDVGPR